MNLSEIVKKKYINKKILLIGVSEGIGNEFFNILSESGADISVITSKNEITTHYKKEINVLSLSGYNINQIEKKIDNFIEKLQIQDVIIYSSGINYKKNFYDLDYQSAINIMHINFLLYHCIVSIIINKLKINHKGIICSFSTGVCIAPIKYTSLYGASKAALLHYNNCLRTENFHNKIKFIDIFPGYLNTNFDKNLNEYRNKNENNRFKAIIILISLFFVKKRIYMPGMYLLAIIVFKFNNYMFNYLLNKVKK
jgi:uncharacterized protein